MKERATPMKEQDLTLVGLTEDKQRLVLVNAAGEEFTLPADARLRAALRGDHARLGQLEITMDSALRPRDIQARIRAGESPEHVAAAAQTTLDKVMGYATPVLAERAHIADRAQKASVRRKAGEGPPGRSATRSPSGCGPATSTPPRVEWDAWRREDGRWTLVADYRSGESARHAEFVFDAPGRYVVADDDEARWLVGEQTAVKGPQPRTTPGPRRLSAVEQRRRAAAGRGRHRDGDRGPRAPPVGDPPPTDPAAATAEDDHRGPLRDRRRGPRHRGRRLDRHRAADGAAPMRRRARAGRAGPARPPEPADRARRGRGPATPGQEEEPGLGADLGRDHVRRGRTSDRASPAGQGDYCSVTSRRVTLFVPSTRGWSPWRTS